MKLLILTLATCLLSLGCNSTRTKSKNVSSSEYRSDVDPVVKRFPSFSPAVAVKWRAELLNKDGSRLIPGPSGYRMWGYVQYDSERLKDVMSYYEWLDAPPGFSPEFPFRGKEDKNTWKTSIAFTSAVKSELLIGKVFVNKDSSLVYFDIKGE